MLNAFIDTCVWLDLAQDRKLTPLLLVIENMVREGQLRLLVPKLVHDEFKRNRTRVAQASARSLKGHFQQVREALTRMPGSTRGRKALMKKLEDANHKIPIFGGEAEGVLERIDKLLVAATQLEPAGGAGAGVVLSGGAGRRRSGYRGAQR